MIVGPFSSEPPVNASNRLTMTFHAFAVSLELVSKPSLYYCYISRHRAEIGRLDRVDMRDADSQPC